MVVNKKNIKQSLFELGIQLFLGTRSGFLGLQHCVTVLQTVNLSLYCTGVRLPIYCTGVDLPIYCTGVELPIYCTGEELPILTPLTDRCRSPYCTQAGKMVFTDFLREMQELKR